MQYDERKQLVLRYLQKKWNSDVGVVTPANTGKKQGHSTGAQELIDPPSMQQLLTVVRQACPGLALTVNDMLIDCQRVLVRWTLTGTDSQGYQGRLPTGRPITISGIQLIHCEQDQVVEEWEVIDRLDLLLQFGFVCLPKPPTITLRRPDYAPRVGIDERIRR